MYVCVWARRVKRKLHMVRENFPQIRPYQLAHTQSSLRRISKSTCTSRISSEIFITTSGGWRQHMGGSNHSPHTHTHTRVIAIRFPVYWCLVRACRVVRFWAVGGRVATKSTLRVPFEDVRRGYDPTFSRLCDVSLTHTLVCDL